ncbi:MAG TPA: alanine racemase [Ruminiclostridium sp.]|nr:alanine racemase [Ruminiclostridium sp.]
MSCFLKRTWAEVDADCIAFNYHAIRNYIHEGCKFMAIVKADAYGHGAPFVAGEFEALGADYFGVSNMEEALQLRNSGIKKPILILGYTPSEYAGEMISKNITQTVLDLQYAKELSKAAQSAGGTLKTHIKIDTGMSRIGFLYHDAENNSGSVNEILEVSSLPALDLEGIFTHFAVSDEPEKGFTKIQFARFMDIIEKLSQKGLNFRLRHCCNSAGLLNFPEMQLDMVRPGIILYGMTPSEGMPLPIELKPTMALKTVISQVKTLAGGTAISYGMKYVTDGEKRVATLPVGYADGFARCLSNRADVLICGKRARIIGRVCMDQCMIDVSEIDEAAENKVVTVIGRDGGDTVSMEEIAGFMGTINYETACLIGKRVPRVFYKDGKIVGTQNYILP